MKTKSPSIKKSITKLIIATLCAALILSPKSCSLAVKHGINYCTDILVPSLFPFMILVTFAVNSKVFAKPGKIISHIVSFLFYLPGYTAPTIFLSLVGGYPVGAQGVKSLFDNKQINSEQLNRMMCFCVNAGPAFIISVLGATMLKNISAGILIFFVQIILCVTIGVVCGIHARIQKKNFYHKEVDEKVPQSISQNIVSSTETTARSMLMTCALIMIFSVLVSLAQEYNIFSKASDLLSLFGVSTINSKVLSVSILEITSGCTTATKLSASIPIIATSVGYGGICAHLQVASILDKANFDFSQFCFFRIINALLSGTCVFTWLTTHGETLQAFSTVTKPLAANNSSTTHGSIAIILLCFYFVLTVNSKILKIKEPPKKVRLFEKSINLNNP